MREAFAVIPRPSRGRRVARCFAGIALLAAIVLAGCEAAPPAPAELTADDLWRQAEQALADGQADAAAELFGRSLALDDTVLRRRDAAMELAAAGCFVHAQSLLFERNEPDLLALFVALHQYQVAPPAGYEDDPYVIWPMAEAIRLQADAAAAPAEWAEVSPLRLSAAYLEQMHATWQCWHYLRWLEMPPDERPSEPRTMVLWALDGLWAADLAADRCIVQDDAGEAGPRTLLHLGGWPLEAEGPSRDAAAQVGRAVAQAVTMHWAVWAGPDMLAHLQVAGALNDEGFDVAAVSDKAVYEALLTTVADASWQPARATPSDDAEREDILRLAERLGRLEQLRSDGDALVVAEAAENTDYVPSRHWLSDLAGYVRRGRAAMAGRR